MYLADSINDLQDFNTGERLALSSSSKQALLLAVKDFKPSETRGMCYELLLKRSTKYMLTINVDTSDGLVNGATNRLGIF